MCDLFWSSRVVFDGRRGSDDRSQGARNFASGLLTPRGFKVRHFLNGCGCHVVLSIRDDGGDKSCFTSRFTSEHNVLRTAAFRRDKVRKALILCFALFIWFAMRKENEEARSFLTHAIRYEDQRRCAGSRQDGQYCCKPSRHVTP